MSQGVKLIQDGLRSLLYDPGPSDGAWGPKTAAALSALQTANGQPKTAPVALDTHYPARSAMASFYGPAGGPDCTAGSVVLPFPFPLAWDASQRVSRFACHKKLATPLTAIFADAAEHYGEEKFRYLRLDQFGGCYNYRVMRGGSSLSMHAWGAAVDLDPVNNQLSWGKDRAKFAKPEYEAWWQIVEAAGFISLGRTANMDFMHFEATSGE